MERYKSLGTTGKPVLELAARGETLRQYVQENPTATKAEIAVALKMSSKTIQKLIELYAIPYHFNPHCLDREKLELFIQQNPEATCADICEEFGCALATLKVAIKRWSIPYIAKKRKIEVDVQALQKYITENPQANLEKIGKHFGICGHSIGIVIRRFKLQFKKTRFPGAKPRTLFG